MPEGDAVGAREGGGQFVLLEGAIAGAREPIEKLLLNIFCFHGLAGL